MTTVVSLGSNLGDRLAHLTAGLTALRQEFPLVATSGVYETDAVGGPAEQPAYLNAVVVLDTDDAEAVLAAGNRAERAAGRERAQRWGPRTLDVDVVACGHRRSDDPRLTIPHPRAHERAFVLLPWLEVDPEAELVGHGPVRSLLRSVGQQGVRARPDLRLEPS